MPTTKYSRSVREGIPSTEPHPRDQPTTFRTTKGGYIGKRKALLPEATETRYTKKFAKNHVICGGKKFNQGECVRPAGWGTNHPGQGRCRDHGGVDPRVARRDSPTARRARLRAAMKGDPQRHEVLEGTVTPLPEKVRLNPNKELDQMLGYAVEIDPLTALLWCIRITAGEVQYWTRKLTDVHPEDLFVRTIGGPQLNPVAKQRQAAVDRLAKYSQVAITTGLAERAVRMAEAYGELLANLLFNVAQDLEHVLPAEIRPHFRKKAEQIIPQRLYELEEVQAISESQAVSAR